MYTKEIIEAFHKVEVASVADAVDQITGKRGYMDYSMQPRINDKKVVGPAVTVLEGPSDEFLPPQHALDLIDESAEGSVVVISTGGEINLAVWGGLMTAGAFANKHAGAVLDGGVRDINEIRRDYDFPIFSRGVSPGTTLGRFKTIDSNVPVEVAGVMVHPEDLIIAHTDGVVVVPKANAEAVLALSQEIDQRELEQAKLIVESGSLREGLAKYGRI